MLKTSVIVPTYRRPYDVSRLFECLLSQTTKPDEVLVVDNTITNEIMDLCEEFKSEFNRIGTPLVYLRRTTKKSISHSRNAGAKAAQGEILVFVDSDTMPFPNYLEKILSVFDKNPSAMGVGIWLLPNKKIMEGLRYYSRQILRRLFRLTHDTHNSCRNFEYPVVLSSTIYCQYLLGDTMSFRKTAFDEFQFDENLGVYSYGEDFLFSNQISKKYPNTLLLSPETQSINVGSEEARIKGKELLDIQLRNAKYILTKLWGIKGLLLFGRQFIGYKILGNLDRIGNPKS